MDVDGLLERLRVGEVVAVPRDEFDTLSAAFAYERTVDTGLAGPIHVVHVDDLWAVVEFPRRSVDVAVRPLADADEVDAFIDDRLAVYEKMWDGCGCRPDYWGRRQRAEDPCRRDDEA